MSLVPTIYHQNRNLSRDIDRSRYYLPWDFNVYPYNWDDPRVWWPTDMLRPMDELVTRRVRNQLFRSGMDDWIYPMRWQNYYAGERVCIDEKGFTVDIDVRQFKPHEIVVKTTDSYVIVEANHDKRNEGNDLVERHFLRKYLLPRGFNTHDVISDLSADGILSIRAPPPPPTKYYNPSERFVRVKETGRPALTWK